MKIFILTLALLCALSIARASPGLYETPMQHDRILHAALGQIGHEGLWMLFVGFSLVGCRLLRQHKSISEATVFSLGNEQFVLRGRHDAFAAPTFGTATA